MVDSSYTYESDLAGLAQVAIESAKEFATKNVNDITKYIKNAPLKPGETSKRFNAYSTLEAVDAVELEDATPQKFSSTATTLTPTTKTVPGKVSMEADFASGYQLFYDWGIEAAAQMIKRHNLDFMKLMKSITSTVGKAGQEFSKRTLANALAALYEKGILPNSALIVVTPYALEQIWNTMTNSDSSDNLRAQIEQGAPVPFMGNKIICLNGLQEETGIIDANNDTWIGVIDQNSFAYVPKWEFRTRIVEKPLSNSYEVAMTSSYAIGQVTQKAVGVIGSTTLSQGYAY